MMLRVWMMALVAIVPLTLQAADEPAADEGWVTLFNGENLDGWVQRNGTAEYRVEDGAIVGTTKKGSPNSFLTTEKQYGDFELTFEVKVDKRLNSGVQVRSHTKDDKPDGRFGGPQVEIEAGNAEAAYIYGEGLGTGWLSKNLDKKTPVNGDEWTPFRVVAKGPVITTYVNGNKVEELNYNETAHAELLNGRYLKGYIGLQVHSFGGDPPAEVSWRNIKIKELN